MARRYLKKALARGGSYRGRFYAYNRLGQDLAAAWPPKRGAPQSEPHKQTVRLFQEANAAFKRQDGSITANQMAAAKDTPFLPRDFAFKMFYGTIRDIRLADGTVLRSMATRLKMSALLDNIAAVPGSLLFRNNELWEAIPPGVAGQWLQFVGVDAKPIWTAPSPTGVPACVIVRRTTDQTPSATTPETCVWQSTARADWSGWASGTPTVVTIPTGATRARITVMVQYTSPNALFGMDIVLLLSGTAVNTNGWPRVLVEVPAGVASSAFVNMSSAWVDVVAGATIALRMNKYASATIGFLTATWMSVEIA